MTEREYLEDMDARARSDRDYVLCVRCEQAVPYDDTNMYTDTIEEVENGMLKLTGKSIFICDKCEAEYFTKLGY